MKRLMTAFASFMLLLVNTTTFAVTDGNTLIPNVGHAKSPDEAWMFIIRAEQASVTQGKDTYLLTLSGLDNRVLIVAERPARAAGQMQLASFMHEWNHSGNDSFRAVPPNAVVLYNTQEPSDLGIAQGTAVILANPVATPNGWTFNVKRINNKPIPVGTYDNVVIFIDGKKWGAPRITLNSKSSEILVSNN